VTLIKNSAEGGTATVACTGGVGGNTGGGSGRYFDTVSVAGSAGITFSNEQAKAGSLSYKMVTNATDAHYLEWIPTAASAFAARLYLYLPSLPSAGNGFFRIRTAGGGTTLLYVVITNARVEIQNTAGTMIWNSGSTTVPTGQWVRLEIKATNGNTSTGTCDMSWYVGDSNTPISGLTATLTGQNFGTSNFGRMQVGRIGAFGSWASFYLDGLAYNDGATTFIGPDANVLPTVDAGAKQDVSSGATVNLSATANDSDGSIAEVEWTFDFPTEDAPELTGEDTLTPSFTAGAEGELYILRCTVTDNDGGTASDTVEVRVPTDDDVDPLPMDGVTVSAWIRVGDAETDGAALADADDDTYTESPDYTLSEQWEEYRLRPMKPRSGLEIDYRHIETAEGGTIKVRLMEGSTQREEWTISQSTSATTQKLTAANPGAISDWGDIRVRPVVVSS